MLKRLHFAAALFAAIIPAAAFAQQWPTHPVKVIVGYAPNILAVYPGIAANNIAELIAMAKAQPGKLSFATSGVGSTQHLAGELFQILTGTKLIHAKLMKEAKISID